MDITELAVMVGEIKTDTKAIRKQNESLITTQHNHSRRLASLESRRWGWKLAVGALVAIGSLGVALARAVSGGH